MDITGRPAATAEPVIRTVGFNIAGETPPTPPPPECILHGSPAPVIIPLAMQATTDQRAESEMSELGPLDEVDEDSVADSVPEPEARESVLRPSASCVGINSHPASGGSPPTTSQFEAATTTAPTVTQGAKTQSQLEAQTPKPASATVGETGAAEKKKASPPAKAEKPKLSRAERREVQERQRAEKEAKKLGGGAATAGKPPTAKSTSSSKTEAPSAASASAQAPATSTTSDAAALKKSDSNKDLTPALKTTAAPLAPASHRRDLFSHLPQYEADAALARLLSKVGFAKGGAAVPPAAVELGMKYLNGSISGGSARVVAMLRMLQTVIADYKTPPQKTFSRDLTNRVNHIIKFLIGCRPMSVSMGNAIRWLKLQIASLAPRTMSEQEAKAALVEDIDNFIQEKVVFAGKVIVSHAVTKISEGDVVLTYARSAVVAATLLEAHRLGCKFRVVVVDSRPKNEGRALLKTLLEAGLQCTYIHINALTFIMREVTKVFLGAASVTANGTVVSRLGTASVAMVAHEWGIPVMICCETNKFQEKVQLDSICSNELGNPKALVTVAGKPELNHLEEIDESTGLHVVNLTYDAMPAEYITMIITEFGMIPATSVPVIIREYRKEPSM